MKRHQTEVSEEMIRRCRGDDEHAICSLYRVLNTKFLYTAWRIVHDDHMAQEIFDDAFLKFRTSLIKGKFSWQGVPQLFSYFEKALHSVATDFLQKTRKWAHEVPFPKGKEDGQEPGDPLPDPYDLFAEEEARVQKAATFRKIKEAAEKLLSPTERVLFAACIALSQIPGSDSWPHHKKTAFLQRYSGLTGNRFYVSYSRMKTKIKRLLKDHSLLHGERR